MDDIRNKHTISVHNADDGSLLKQWNVYRCLQGSIDHDGERYSLSDGRWFLVAANFREAIESTFSACRAGVDDAEFPEAVLVEKSMKKGKKTVAVEGIESEGAYNERAAAELGFMFLDKETGSVPGIANQKNELCDLLSFAERRLIHVKKGSRSSGALHHLFRQGATAARMLRDPAFLKAVSDRLRNANREQDAQQVDQLSTGNNLIEFRIIDKPRTSGDFDIPFFAKVALHYAVREILESGNTAKLGFVDHSD